MTFPSGRSEKSGADAKPQTSIFKLPIGGGDSSRPNSRMSFMNTSPDRLLQKTQIDRLKRQLQAKEKENKALTQAVAELKNELISAGAHQARSHIMASSSSDVNQLKLKIDELATTIDRNKSDLKMSQVRERTAKTEADRLQSEIDNKDVSIQRLRADKERLEKEVDNLERRLSHLRNSMKMKLYETESRELKQKVVSLENQLRELQQAPAERPLETTEATKEKTSVLRWEETKRWQKKVEILAHKITEKDTSIENNSKLIIRLREAVQRLEKEKLALEQQLSRRSGQTATDTKETEEVATIRKQNQDLKATVNRLENRIRASKRTETELRELRYRNAVLEEKCDSLEQQLIRMNIQPLDGFESTSEVDSGIASTTSKISKTIEKEETSEQTELKVPSERSSPSSGQSSSSIAKELEECKRSLNDTKSERNRCRQNLRDKVAECEELREKLRKMERDYEELEEDMNDNTQSAANLATINHLHGLVDELEKEKKKLVEENEELRVMGARNGITVDVEKLYKENKELKEKINRTAPRVVWSEEVTGETGFYAATRLASQNEQLQKDIRKERAENESLVKQLADQDIAFKRLEDELQRIQDLSSNTRQWRPQVIEKLYEDKMKEHEQTSDEQRSKVHALQELLKQEIEKNYQQSMDLAVYAEKLKVYECRECLESNMDRSAADMTELRAELTAANINIDKLKKNIEVLERQIKPALLEHTGLDLKILRDRLKNYDRVLQENIKLKLERNTLQATIEACPCFDSQDRS